ncbi:uncharacterized protein PHACADRAFT_166337 [Phanerochaete carnosa HHB-10118-sp]|uniref:Uncharacterized protein n=1 Tax=Phanerochaete carnosa (strain HHB-10118-sp) TaxID=650164 RepID=K5VHF1_PHACS|nr:uncharacterized protein PHACADRAFT_166337 [Phanerochaete carnosa HHB-10118-sp]EKM50663.1 hypothetical protein PHACADRAFT_166337 [Phanerochaete carnosa HHB-10118-sp]
MLDFVVSAGKRVPKKVDVELPGPSPTSQITAPKKPAGKAKHSRAQSVVSNSATSVDDTEPPIKSPSVQGADKLPSSRSNSQDEHSDDDAVSVAESAKARKRKREPDRIQFFNDDPRCRDVEPHRALCAKCDTWISLHARRRYVMQNWIEHRKLCVGPSNAVSSAAPADAPLVAKPKEPSEAEAEGRTALEGDSRTGEIRPHEVFCTSCNAWIALDLTARYMVTNWKAHVQECPGAVVMPSPNMEPSIEGLTSAPAPSRAQPDSPAAPRNTSTSPKLSPSKATTSRKRGREEDEDEDAEETRAVRPRPASYKPSRGQALWDTLATPFRAFVQGFKEGMNASSSAST